MAEINVTLDKGENVVEVHAKRESPVIQVEVIGSGPMGPQGPAGADGQNGADGYSPTVTVETITGGHRVTITDAEGDHVFDVMDGQGGQGSDDVFIAAYGTTTSAEIETALTAGQIVFCKLTNAGVDYYLPMTRRYSATDHRFAAQYSATDIYTIGCSCISNAWNSWNRRMMPLPSSASSGDALVYNGSAWAAKALDASDVGAIAAPASPATGSFLVYTGNAWEAVPLSQWSGGSY